jgi:hypothetical protein
VGPENERRFLVIEIFPNELATSPIFCEINQTRWRDGRVAEGDGLLNRYTVKSRIGGSNPPLSAIFIFPLYPQRF